MDPFSITIGVVSLMQLTVEALVLVKALRSSAVGRRASMEKMFEELELLQRSLESLDRFISSDISASHIPLDKTSVLRLCISSCEDRLTRLITKLESVKNTGIDRLVWPMSEREHQKSIQELRSYSQWIQFALTVDGFAAVSRTSDDVLKLLKQQLEGFKSLDALQNDVAYMRETSQRQFQILQEDRKSNEKNAVLNWVSPNTDYLHKHHAIRSMRVEGTGSWLLECREFKEWLAPSSERNLLWCHGIQGSGKTVLSSWIVDELLGSAPKGDSVVAFIYLDYHDRSRQNLSAIISGILRQLLAMTKQFPEVVIKVYEKNLASGAVLTETQVEKLTLDTVLAIREAVYVVIDALDEYDDLNQRKELLRFLGRLKGITKVKILLTSRPHPRDINVAFRDANQFQIRAHDADIKLYMQRELREAEVQDILDDELEGKIVQRLLQSANGMFLLPVLQLRSLLKEPTAGELEEALDSLSSNLSEAFEETITRIRRLSPSRTALAFRALEWICYASRPMTGKEICDALATKPGHVEFLSKYRPSARTVVECCQGLIRIDPETDIVRLAHFSVKEYLSANENELFREAPANLATTCLTFLMFHNLKRDLCDDFPLDRLEESPFLSYAASYWGTHVRLSESHPSVSSLTSNFLRVPAAFQYSNQIQQFVRGRIYRYWCAAESRTTTALHMASRFGLRSNLLRLLEDGDDVNALTANGGTALMSASGRGHLDVVRLLLQYGADYSLENWYGDALHAAAEAGQSEIIRELIGSGMDPDALSPLNKVPLECAMDNDYHHAFETLVGCGAQIAGSHIKDSILHLAVSNACPRIIELILQNGWVDVDAQNDTGQTPLHLAAMLQDPHISRQLIAAGANINARDNRATKAKKAGYLERMLFPETAPLPIGFGKPSSGSNLVNDCRVSQGLPESNLPTLPTSETLSEH